MPRKEKNIDSDIKYKEGLEFEKRKAIHMRERARGYPEEIFTSTTPSSWSAQTPQHESGRGRPLHLLACHACL